ncbi:MAG: hypothetical protein RBS25_02155 [Bacilli bacterium]|jgi:hypothetical protein|nr:hypothetical protein [Bacilli bacterium]
MKNKENFIEEIHRWGKIWGITAAIAITAFPFALMIIYQALPEWKGLLVGFTSIIPLFWAVGIIEIATYVPMIGAGASYLSFVTGNITNLKAPAALTAMENAQVKSGTEEGEIISTIAVAVSSIVTTLILAIGVLLIVLIRPVGAFLQSEAIRPAFDNVLPALFGGLAVVYVSKNWKIAIFPIILMLVLFIFIDFLDASKVGIMVPVGAIVTIFVSKWMYKKGWLTAKKSKGENE